MSRKITINVLSSIFIGLMLLIMVSGVQAQATPTRPPIPDLTPTPGPEGSISTDRWGTVRGYVYTDVNGDGVCVNTGVAGEEPAVGIPVEFVSSDEQHVITHTSGEHGEYELARAGLSHWRVTVKPDGMVVTSENPQYALVAKDHLAATDVNFCVSEGYAYQVTTAVYPMIEPLTVSEVPEDGTYVLPEAGAPAATPTTTLWPMLIGISLIILGLGWRWYEANE